MGYTLHSASVGLKMLASWWNEFVSAIGDLDIRTLRLEALAPVENSSATSGTQNTTSYAASSSGALTAACVVPASGDIRVTVQAEQYGTAVNVVQRTSAAITVTSGSGAAAASDVNSIKSVSVASGTSANNGIRGSCSWLITGMTPGATVTATMQHRVETATGTNTFLNRRISIEPLTGY